MKKYVFLLLCIALIACIVGVCGSESDITDEKPIVESNEITMKPVEEQTEELETIDLKVLSGKVVVLGDSIWGLDKGSEGIGRCLEEITSLEVLNYCIPGTCASKIEGYYGSKDSMEAILVDNDNEKSEEIKNAISEARYVFIEHCANDCSMAVPLTGDNSYESALLNSIAVIKELNPDAEIVMLIPTLSYLINMDQLSNEYNFGEGTIDDYISVMKSVAEREGASVVNMQEAWTLTKENWSDYLVDGSHLKKTARREYADFLAQKLYELFAK